VRRALAALFGGAVGKDTVSRTWRKVKSDWDAWNASSLADEPIVVDSGWHRGAYAARSQSDRNLAVVTVGEPPIASRDPVCRALRESEFIRARQAC